MSEVDETQADLDAAVEAIRALSPNKHTFKANETQADRDVDAVSEVIRALSPNKKTWCSDTLSRLWRQYIAGSPLDHRDFRFEVGQRFYEAFETELVVHQQNTRFSFVSFKNTPVIITSRGWSATVGKVPRDSRF